jgi:neurotransmitter:Na+ symporter, NSS family
VGLGNIWRFPFVAGENGGGAFLLPYLISVVLVAGPAMLIELAAGRAARHGVVGTFSVVAPYGRRVGLFLSLGVVALVSYYLVVTGWALGYSVHAFANSHPTFERFTTNSNSVWFFLVATGSSCLVVALGVNRGIEAFSRILMPALVMLLLALAIYALTLPSRDEALTFYLSPDFSALARPIVWVRALGQAFFSIGVGMGVLITYGAYMERRSSVVQSAAIVTFADTGIALLAGLVIFPLAFSLGTDPGAGPQLAFDTLPRTFDSFSPTTGYIVALGFYLSLTMAALTSAVALIETATVGLQDGTGWRRNRSLAIVALAVIALGIPSALSYSGTGLEVAGRPVLDLMDAAIGNFGLSVGAAVTMLLLSWRGRSLLEASLDARALNVRAALWLTRWIVPIAVLVVLGAMTFDLIGQQVLPEGG